MIDSMTRRDVLAAGLAAAAPIFAAKHRNLDKSDLSAITDEIGRTAADAFPREIVVAREGMLIQI